MSMRASSFTRVASPTPITVSRALSISANGGSVRPGCRCRWPASARAPTLGDALIAAAERAIRDSVQYAFDHPEASRTYVRAHAQEMSEEVCAAHIALYVNEHSLDIGDDGMRAIARLVAGYVSS